MGNIEDAAAYFNQAKDLPTFGGMDVEIYFTLCALYYQNNEIIELLKSIRDKK